MKPCSFTPFAGPLLTLAICCSMPDTGRVDEGKAGKTYEVETVSGLAYYEGNDADPIKHKLDLYLPKGRKDFPVLFFVHGGAWMHGDKNLFGIYSAIGKRFAELGIGTVVTNYRLTPKVMHPEHIKDVAKAFAWTQKNIAKHGGRADQIFVCGHSAGGHLVSLLATDETYLKAEGLSTTSIRGVIPLSGVYVLPGNLFSTVFGKDATVRKQAEPLSHVRAGLPPFLIIYAESDFPGCDKTSGMFCDALTTKECKAQTLEVKKCNHITIILNVPKDKDPSTEAILDFIMRHTRF